LPKTAYIVHTGIVTSIGRDTEECLQSLIRGSSGIGRARILQTTWADEIPVGEIALRNEELAALTGAPASWPRTALLGAMAAREAWAPFASAKARFPVGFFSANTVGGMDLTEAFYPKFLQDKDDGGPADYSNHECGAITQLVGRHLGFRGFTTTISTACSSSANSIMMAAQMIRAGMLDLAVAGGADALCRFTLNGFNTLGILDRQPCQPFDAQRRGLNLGEGAGYVVLMSERALQEYAAQPIAAVSGWGNANDAYHQTASSPEGAGNKLAIEAALGIAGLQAPDISYINLHGTGTANNDSAEGKAIEQVFTGRVPPASSTKAYTGHTLGAAGGVEAVFSALAIRDGLIFPNLRWASQMEDVAFTPVTVLQDGQRLRHVLSNSFGFGGACSSLILSRC
jgi:3-oxoacyl-[acyl-carrier-protein] synthase-1